MTRVHALVLIVLVLTVVIHGTLAGLVSLLSRRARSRKDTVTVAAGRGARGADHEGPTTRRHR